MVMNSKAGLELHFDANQQTTNGFLSHNDSHFVAQYFEDKVFGGPIVQ